MERIWTTLDPHYVPADVDIKQAAPLFICKPDDTLPRIKARNFCKTHEAGYNSLRYGVYTVEMPNANLGKALRRTPRGEAVAKRAANQNLGVTE